VNPQLSESWASSRSSARPDGLCRHPSSAISRCRHQTHLRTHWMKPPGPATATGATGAEPVKPTSKNFNKFVGEWQKSSASHRNISSSSADLLTFCPTSALARPDRIRIPPPPSPSRPNLNRGLDQCAALIASLNNISEPFNPRRQDTQDLQASHRSYATILHPYLLCAPSSTAVHPSPSLRRITR